MPAVTQGGTGAWLADIAANVLAITLLVLIALARLGASDAPQPPATQLIPRATAPIGGPAAVEMLRQRLLPGAGGHLDVTTDMAPVTGPVTVLFVLDPASYPQALAGLPPGDWQELTVPRALKTPENRWDPAFLALAPLAADAGRFRTALQALLVSRAGDAPATSAALSGQPPPSRFALWFDRALDVLGLMALGAALYALTRLRRWAVTA